MNIYSGVIRMAMHIFVPFFSPLAPYALFLVERVEGGAASVLSGIAV